MDTAKVAAWVAAKSDPELAAIAGMVAAEQNRRGLAVVGGDQFLDLVASMRIEQKAFYAATYGTIARAEAQRRAMALESKVDRAIGDNRNQIKMEL